MRNSTKIPYTHTHSGWAKSATCPRLLFVVKSLQSQTSICRWLSRENIWGTFECRRSATNEVVLKSSAPPPPTWERERRSSAAPQRHSNVHFVLGACRTQPRAKKMQPCAQKIIYLKKIKSQFSPLAYDLLMLIGKIQCGTWTYDEPTFWPFWNKCQISTNWEENKNTDTVKICGESTWFVVSQCCGSYAQDR